MTELRLPCLVLVAASLLVTSTAGAAKVHRVTVEGNRRAEAQAVLEVVRTKPGQELDPGRVSEDIRRVYSLKYFDDVVVEGRQGPQGSVVVTFRVHEKPAIRKILYEGLEELGKDDVEEVVDLKPFSILDVSEVKRNAQKIRDLYTEKGYFLAEVDFRLERISEYEVDVVFVVSEHAKVQVRKITILGNRAFSDEEILGRMMTRERSFLSFLTSEGNFKREILERDVMVIRSLYMDHGYVNVKVSEPQVSLTPDKEGIFISIRIVEGKQYRLGTVTVSGDLLVPKDELMGMLKIRTGEIFDQSKLFKDIERISDLYKDEGYAFVNVNPLSSTHDDRLTIDLDLHIEKGKLVRFGRITVAGNAKTRDKVIRRELRIYEGELYSATGIRLSKRNVTRLGFFESVEFKTQRGERDDLMDVRVEVKERQTGAFQMGMGLSTYENLMGTVQVSQNNLMGRGQYLNLQGTISSLRQYINLHFGEPHFLDTNWLLSFDLFKYRYDFADFSQGSTGGSITLGYQLTDDLRVSFTYENSYIEFERRSRPWEAERGRTSSVKGLISLDTRNDRFLPSSGWYVHLSEEVATRYLASENEFSRTLFGARYYYPLIWKFVAMANLEYGLASPLGPRPVPQFERFRVGGIHSVRGFQRLSLSPIILRSPPQSDPTGRPVPVREGGTEEVIMNLEVQFPLFEQMGIRGVVFHDMGMAYDVDGTILAKPRELVDGLRASWGFGFRWFSPMGPLRFEWGFPYDPRPGENGHLFEFTVGNF